MPRRYHGLIGLALFLVSETLMLAGVRPFTLWFYPLAWWSYIFLVDQVVYQRKGDSLWVSRRREFLLLVPMSAGVWMIFEGLNHYLGNWQYVGIVREAWLRWPGYFISYGTVLPALFETTELLETTGLFRKAQVRPLPVTTAWYLPFVAVGALFLYLPLLWPRYFFPLVWGGFIFLLEPLLHGRGGRSLMREWEVGRPRTFYLLLTAGLICGGLWEFWNFWAVSKWVYTVPLVGWLKVFEMPLLGFGGFPPFAVECYVMAAALSLPRGGRGWRQEDAVRPGGASGLTIVLCVILFLFVFIVGGLVVEFQTIKSYV
ncbi:MAG: hypothetical protein AB1896_10760 [Thermodesulfobacteriota bacterium]